MWHGMVTGLGAELPLAPAAQQLRKRDRAQQSSAALLMMMLDVLLRPRYICCYRERFLLSLVSSWAKLPLARSRLEIFLKSQLIITLCRFVGPKIAIYLCRCLSFLTAAGTRAKLPKRGLHRGDKLRNSL